MTVFNIITVLIALGLAALVAVHAPRLVAMGVAKLVWHMGQARAERLINALMAPREQAVDRWARTSKEERKLLAAALKDTMSRTQMRSLLPQAF